jgi:hypothetical protein
MLSLPQIQRLALAREFRVLADRVLDNGRACEPSIRNALQAPDAVGVASIGLALQRCCELSYSPTPLTAALSSWLIEQQRSDGLFGSGARPSIPASAVAIRSLLDVATLHRDSGRDGASAAGLAAGRAIATLARLLTDRAFDGNDPTDNRIIEWQLGDSSDFLRAVDLRRTRAWKAESDEDQAARRIVPAVAA